MKLFAAVILNLFLVLPALAASPVWEVKAGDSVLYLGGTCHVLRASDYPLPAAFDRAYDDAAAVVFETDIGEMSTPAFQQKMAAALLYHDGRSLADELSPEAYQALVRYCEEAGVPIELLQPMKPALAVMTLAIMELQKHGISLEGVDKHFHTRAQADGKRVEELETAEEQLGFLAVLGKGMEDELIEQTLADLGRTGEAFEEVVEAWKRGNGQELSRLLIEPTRTQFADIYQSLFVARNTAWLPRIETFLATPERELVLVGAGHLVGGDGLLALLRKKGYAVTQLD